MARKRDPRREQAFEIWKQHNGDITNRQIAEMLDVPERTIATWKIRDKWNEVLQTDERSTSKKGRGGAPKGNQNAKGNRGGAAPKGNTNAVKHGFFRTIFPDDEETLAIVEAIHEKDPLDILWENIVIQYTAIVRAQKIMFVQDRDDQTKVLRKQKELDIGWEKEWELQHAWDKHANFLQAQSRAMATLQSLIKRYEEMIQSGLATEEQRLRIEKLKVEIDVIKQTKSEQSAEDWVEALRQVAAKRKNGGDVS